MNRNLHLLNGLAIIAVVTNHSAGWGFTAQIFWTHRYLDVSVPNFDQVGTAGYWLLLVLKQLTLFSVPAFLFLSGTFMAYAGRSESIMFVKMARSRLLNLLIPYLLWSTIYLLWQTINEGVRPWDGYLLDLLTGHGNPAFFFIIVLIQLTLLSPLLIAACKKAPVFMFLLGLAVQAAVIAGNYYNYFSKLHGEPPLEIPIWLFSGWFFYFCSGILFAQQARPLVNKLERARPFLPGLLTAAGVGNVIEGEIWFRLSGDPGWVGSHFSLGTFLYATLFVLTYIAFMKDLNLPHKGFLVDISGKTFGIYLAHWLVLEIVSRTVYHIAPFLLPQQVIFQPLLIAAGVGIPYAIAKFFSRTELRVYYRYIFG